MTVLDAEHRLTAEVYRTHLTRRILGLAALGGALVVVFLLSIALGARDIPLGTVVDALTGRLADTDYDSIVIFSERIPRTLLGLCVGLCLGASGLIMQAITRNPLADPGVLGVEAGAGLAVLLGIVVLGASGYHAYFWLALVGAGLTAVLVWGIARLATATTSTLSMVIGGAAIAALISSIITLVTVRDPAAFLRYRAWAVGMITSRPDLLVEMVPFVVAALAAALLLAGWLNALSLGDDVAAALGTNVRRARGWSTLVAVALCAVPTAAVGPVAFIGLVGAHIARQLVGTEHRWLIPCSMLCGGLVLMGADVLGRLAPGNGEVEVGIVAALVGTPVFLLLARRRGLVTL